jgi:hypothetical protein
MDNRAAGDTSREAVERLIDRLLRASRRTKNAGKSAAAHGDTGAAWFCEREAADIDAAVFALRDLLDAREANYAVAERMKRERDEARAVIGRSHYSGPESCRQNGR